MTAGELLEEGECTLAEADNGDASFDACVLLAHTLSVKESSIAGRKNETVSEEDINRYRTFISRRASREPLQYITGEWDFYKYSFYCGQGVLIPRPETEELAALCIDYIKKNNIKNIADLCAGTGCIGISIALDCPGATVTEVEKYDDAFSYLLKNIERNKAPNVNAVKDDVLAPSAEYGTFDLIVSNPPYIEASVMPSLQDEVKKEPSTALCGGEDGLVFYRAIKEIWFPLLRNGGMLAVECGETQTEKIAAMFGGCKTACINDIYGNPRIVTVIR